MSQGKHVKKVNEEEEILTHDQVMRILSSQARQGSVTAAASLERALRAQAREQAAKETSFEDELAILTK